MRGRMVAGTLLVLIISGCGAGQEYISVEGNYRIAFPTKPQSSQQDVPTELGPIVAKTCACEDWGGRLYMVTYADYPPGRVNPGDADAVLEGGCEGMVTTAKMN